MFAVIVRDPYFRVTLPHARDVDKVLELAKAFAAKEATLPAAQQTPYSGDIAALLTEAEPANVAVTQSEKKRTRNSEQLKRIDELAAEYYRRAKKVVQAHFVAEPEAIEAWGFDVWQTGRRRGNVKPIYSRASYLAFFEQYVEQEESQPEMERFRFVPLAEMRRVRDGLRDFAQGRDEGLAERQQMRGVLRHDLIPELLDYLRLGLGHLIMKTFGRRVLPELSGWGYAVTQRANGRSSEPDTAPEDESFSIETIEMPNGIFDTDPDTGVSAADLAAPPATEPEPSQELGLAARPDG